MERLYGGSKILFLESRAHVMFYRFAFAILPFIVDLTFDKILNTYMRRVTVSKELARSINSLTHMQKIPFLQIPS